MRAAVELISGFRRRRFHARAVEQALQQARMLDEVVAAHTRLLPKIPAADREGTTDYLVELVQLGRVYRCYAQGWISRRDMQRQAQLRSSRLDELRWGRLIAELSEGS